MKIHKISQPPIDPDSRPSEKRGPWRGLQLALAGLVLLILGAKASHTIWVGGSNRNVSQSELVRTVTANEVRRPLPGQAATQLAPMDPQQDSGQADCPT